MSLQLEILYSVKMQIPDRRNGILKLLSVHLYLNVHEGAVSFSDSRV